MKDTSVAMKKPKSPGRPSFKSPGRPSFKSPKAKKGSIRIEPQLIKPVYKNKLQPKTKFKFPPKKPVVKKSSGKMSLTPTIASELLLISELLFCYDYYWNLNLLGYLHPHINHLFSCNLLIRKLWNKFRMFFSCTRNWTLFKFYRSIIIASLKTRP